jgi:hypothetical protein
MDINNHGWFQILAELCCDSCTLNDASHHNIFQANLIFKGRARSLECCTVSCSTPLVTCVVGALFG